MLKPNPDKLKRIATKTKKDKGILSIIIDRA